MELYLIMAKMLENKLEEFKKEVDQEVLFKFLNSSYFLRQI